MAKITIVNEEGQNLNRYLITPTDGSAPFTADLARAANITKQGTPFDPETMEHYVQSEDLQEHTENTIVHVSEQERGKWNDGMTATATHTKTGTVNNLTIPDGAKNLTFLATADLADGDTWTVNGNPVTAVLQNGEALPGELFKSGCWVTGVRLSDDGTQLTFPGKGAMRGLTIGVGNGGTSATYTGAAAVSITIPKLVVSTSAPSGVLPTGTIHGVY